jgi:hypothetical protein
MLVNPPDPIGRELGLDLLDQVTDLGLMARLL